MKITCERAYLANALGVVGRAVSNRNTLAILNNILLETADDVLKLTATDLDTSIRYIIPAAISENGAVAVPAGVLTDVVSKLGDGLVSLDVMDGKVQIRSGKSDYNILSQPAEDFPVVPEVADGTEITVHQATLKEMLRLTTFAASKEETRSVLMGVLFEVRGNALTLVATDTHRLAWKRATLTQEVENPVTAIVPARPLIELERVLNTTESVHIRFGASQVQFETEHATVVSRVLDGQFPNYEKVIPKASERKIIFDREEFLAAVRRVFIVARLNSEKAIIETKGDILVMTAESQEVGRAYEEVPISMDGSDLKIAFNARYLVEVLGLLETQSAALDLTGPLNPGILRAEGDPDFLYVVMPMQA